MDKVSILSKRQNQLIKSGVKPNFTRREIRLAKAILHSQVFSDKRTNFLIVIPSTMNHN